MDNSNFAEFNISLESLKRQMENSLKQASKDLLYSEMFMRFAEHFLFDESMLNRRWGSTVRSELLLEFIRCTSK